MMRTCAAMAHVLQKGQHHGQYSRFNRRVSSRAPSSRGRRVAPAGAAGQRHLSPAPRDRPRRVPDQSHASMVEGARCYHDVAEVPQPLDGVVIVTSPQASADVVRQCADAHVPRVWFHRSFGSGSVSDDAVRACAALGIEAIVGGCPLMFCGSVDGAHKCMRWWLQRRRRVPM